MKKIYTLINYYEPHDSFEVEGENENDAAINALDNLGWRICEQKKEKNNPDQFEFNF
jgi:hypothetical protein